MIIEDLCEIKEQLNNLKNKSITILKIETDFQNTIAYIKSHENIFKFVVTFESKEFLGELNKEMYLEIISEEDFVNNDTKDFFVLIPKYTQKTHMIFTNGKEFKNSEYYFDTMELISDTTEIAYMGSICIILDDYDPLFSGFYYDSLAFEKK